MDRRTSFLIYIAIFIVTWLSNFAVRGIPKNRNEQCMELGYNAACTVRENRHACQILTCARHRYSERTNRYDNIQYRLIPRYGVPDYTECGQSKICMNGKCVEATGPMPQYQTTITQVACRDLLFVMASSTSEFAKHRLLDDPVMTRREQCQQYGFDVACIPRMKFKTAPCSILSCGYKEGNGVYFSRARRNLPMTLLPTNGSLCGRDQVCLNRRCVPLQEWLLTKKRPTYTGPEQLVMCCPEPSN